MSTELTPVLRRLEGLADAFGDALDEIAVPSVDLLELRRPIGGPS